MRRKRASGIASASAAPIPSAPSAAVLPRRGESAQKGGNCAVTSSGHLTNCQKIVGSDEVHGSVTACEFCAESVNDGQSQLHTVHFDIKFNQPFTSSQVIAATRARKA